MKNRPLTGEKGKKLLTDPGKQLRLGNVAPGVDADDVVIKSQLDAVGGGGTWGNINGDITDQTDLVDYVADEIQQASAGANLKVPSDTPISNTSGDPVPGFTFALEANSIYEFEIQLHIETLNASGFKFAVNGPAGSTLWAETDGWTSSGGTDNISNLAVVGGLSSATYATVATIHGWAEIKGSIETGSTAGDFTFIVAPVSSSSGGLNVKKLGTRGWIYKN